MRRCNIEPQTAPVAIFHCSTKLLARAAGRSAPAGSAYRTASKITNERDGVTHDYTRRGGVVDTAIIVPGASGAAWALDRSVLWNRAEKAEKRKDARVAREIEIGLPHELTASQRLAVTREFAGFLADRYGVAVEYAIHTPQGKSDVRNHHAHLMMTTRVVNADGLGAKSEIELKNADLLNRNLPTSHMQLREIRRAWEGIANRGLAAAGHDISLDHRSHMDRGLYITPTSHVGVHATNMARQGMDVSRVRLAAEAARVNAELIRDHPEQVLTLIIGEKSVFDRYDIAKALHRAIDDPDQFHTAMAAVMASRALVELRPAYPKALGGAALARYSTRAVIALEAEMMARAAAMAKAQPFAVRERFVIAAIAAQDAELRRAALAMRAAGNSGDGSPPADAGATAAEPRLSDEQRRAIAHITGASQVVAVVGYAGAGKSTMLAAARVAWEAAGYTVRGAALSGKAADGLQGSSGIQSGTLASLEAGLDAGRITLGPADVLVIDEAGMVSSQQMARWVSVAHATGAKLVLVGDHEQLQAIGAGAPFRAITEAIGFAELQDIRRQREPWQRQASAHFAQHQTTAGLAAYARHGAVGFHADRAAAQTALVQDYVAHRLGQSSSSSTILAHLRLDVRELNDQVRALLQANGTLASGADAGEIACETRDGPRAFAPGDRIVFLENSAVLDVKNGMLGTVREAGAGRLTVALDLRASGGERLIDVDLAIYNAIDHGYALTIHKIQGDTVDQAFVLASASMDRHLAYVAMTRHRDAVHLYVDREELPDMAALSARLGRDGSKENTIDYDQGRERTPSVEAFARRRGIETAADILPALAEWLKQRSAWIAEQRAALAKLWQRAETAIGLTRERFAAALPKSAGALIVDDLDLSAPWIAPVSVLAVAGVAPASPLAHALETYGRKLHECVQAHAGGETHLPHEEKAYLAAAIAVDAIDPVARTILVAAFQYDPTVPKVLTDLQGLDRGRGLEAAIALERAAQQNPRVRAERLLVSWKALEVEYNRVGFYMASAKRDAVEQKMLAWAAALGKDPAAIAVMREHAGGLGIAAESALSQALKKPDVEKALRQSIERHLQPVPTQSHGRSYGR